MATWTDFAEWEPVRPESEPLDVEISEDLTSQTSGQPPATAVPVQPEIPAGLVFQHGWPVPSSISVNPDQARARIQLPEFDDPLLEKAWAIAARFPFWEVRYRQSSRQTAHQSEA